MKRLLWLGAGLAIGALVVRAVSRKARAYSPQGLAAAVRDSGRNAFESVRYFVDDVRDGMQEREDELHAAFLAGRPLGADSDLDDLDDRDLDDRDFDDLDRDAFGDPSELTAAPGSRRERNPTEDPTR
jgi:hypothetical protein